MGLQSCQIIYDNPSAIYYAGQTVTGRAEIVLTSPKKVRGVGISFKGEASTEWTESERVEHNGKTETKTTTFRGDEEYFRIEYYLIGGPNSESIELPTGTHVYPFTCAIPPSAPPSFEGTYGHIRYTVKVTLNRPWKFDQTQKSAFTVLANLDLNVNPRIREPATLTVEKFFCCCWCRSGPLTGILKVPCTGFVPGQVIPITIEVDNASNIDVTDVKIQLRKKVVYYSQSPNRSSRKDTVKITEVSARGVPGRSSNTWPENITVPSLPPSNLTNCHIIDLDYEIKVELVVSGFHHNVVGKLPIMIGTIPLANLAPMAPAVNETIIQMNDSTNSSAPLLGWVPLPANAPPPHFNLPPPSYEECQFGTKNIGDNTDSEHTQFSQKNYAPCYPVYNFNTLPLPPYAPTAPLK